MSRIYELLSLSKDKTARVGALEGSIGQPDNPESYRSYPEAHQAHPGRFVLPEMLIDRDPESLKEFEALLRNLLILNGNNPKTLMVCSAESKSGTSMVAQNLGALMARRLDAPCVLMEANLFSPVLHRHLQGEPRGGLCQLLEEQRPIENYVLPTTEPRLFAMSAGLSGVDHGRLFHPSGLESVLSGLKAAYRMVIIDGPPVLEAGQSLQLVRLVDGVILVIRTGSLADRLRRATAELEKQQARVLGIVMNTP